MGETESNKNDIIYKFSDSEIEFLKQSNYIESEYCDQALEDAMLAWDYFKNNGNPIFQVPNILHCHYLLMKRLNPRIAGNVRKCDVRIGGCHKPFINEELILNDLEQLCMDTNPGNEKESHIKFEFIHPFEDGNGRVGRILWQAHRLKFGLPIQIIYEKDKHEYYKWF